MLKPGGILIDWVGVAILLIATVAGLVWGVLAGVYTGVAGMAIALLEKHLYG